MRISGSAEASTLWAKIQVGLGTWLWGPVTLSSSQDVFYTEAEMERRRLSSVSSASHWAPTPEWVSRFFSPFRNKNLTENKSILTLVFPVYLSPGPLLEV